MCVKWLYTVSPQDNPWLDFVLNIPSWDRRSMLVEGVSSNKSNSSWSTRSDQVRRLDGKPCWANHISSSAETCSISTSCGSAEWEADGTGLSPSKTASASKFEVSPSFSDMVGMTTPRGGRQTDQGRKMSKHQPYSDHRRCENSIGENSIGIMEYKEECKYRP